jgi:hypothetical protein
MYKEFTSLLDETKYDKLDSDVKAAWISAMSSNDDQRYICNTCHWHMKRNRMPTPPNGSFEAIKSHRRL